ncbi:MAG TPA: hypothetical protein VLE72_00825 [Candidatus Saccharimonadales bacterium]|nr:hypothetical protein [Candidatus Saccharimonadales bacterium]
MSEALPNQPESEFKPAINPADLVSDQPHPETAFDALPPDPQIEAHKQVEADRQERETKRSTLLAEGFSQAEANSIISSGYVAPEIYADLEPSDAYLVKAANNEAEKLKSNVVALRPEADYQQRRSEQIATVKKSGTAGLTNEQIERVVSIGYLMPPEYSATPAADLLEKRRQQDLPKAA